MIKTNQSCNLQGTKLILLHIPLLKTGRTHRSRIFFNTHYSRSTIRNILFRTACSEQKTLFCSEQSLNFVPNKIEVLFRTRCSEHFTQTVPNRIFLLFRTNCSEQSVPNTLFRTFYTNCSEQDFFVVPNKLNKLFGTKCSEQFRNLFSKQDIQKKRLYF